MHYIEGGRDPVRILHQGLCAVVRVAQSDDARWVFEAGKFLVEYATHEIERKEALKAAELARHPMKRLEPAGAVLTGVGADSRAALLDELKGLYAKALGPAPLIVEAEPEPSQPAEARPSQSKS